MNIGIVKRISLGVTLSFFIIVLSSCASSYEKMPIELQTLSVEASDSIFPGDTRDNVYSVLGDPLIDARKMGVQVFQHIVPSSMYGNIIYDVYMFSLVTYDENELVKGSKRVVWGQSSINFPEQASIYLDGFGFLGMERSVPQTLLGPSISSKELVETATSEKSCTLVVLYSECPMAKVSLDEDRIIDLGGAGVYCLRLGERERRGHIFYGTYIKKEIPEGAHKIEMKKGRWDKKFESNFECRHGETIFTVFESHSIKRVPWHGIEPDGAITIYKSFPETVIEGDTLRPILWHGGVWYGPLGILGER